MIKKPDGRDLLQITYTAVIALSILFCQQFPEGPWPIGLTLGVSAAVSCRLGLGWVVACTLTGISAGFVMSSPVASGSLEHQLSQRINTQVGYTLGGFVVGLLLDKRPRVRS